MTANLRTPTREEKESLPMKGILMSAAALSMKKMALAIFCVTLLMLVTAPAWASTSGPAADPCNKPTVGTITGSVVTPVGSVGTDTTGSCGLVITITGTSGNLTATFSGAGIANGNPYDNLSDDILVGVQNNSSVAVGAIVLSGLSDVFGFDIDGPCDPAFNPSPYSWCSTAVYGYEGPDNTFVGINSPSNTTGKVVFTTPLPPSPDGVTPGGSTWFALEELPTTVVAIGENQTLAANSTAVYKFGPFSGGGTVQTEADTSPTNPDDFRITPLSGGDSLTVTAVPVPAWPAGTAIAPFQNLQCVPYLDFNTGGPACVQIELDCTSPANVGDSCNFLYTAQLDYGIDNAGLPPGDQGKGVGGPALLVQHNIACGYPTTGYTENIFLSYSGSTPGGVDPPLLGGGKGSHSCYIAAFNPDPSIPPVLQGQTVSTFGGFEFPSNTKTNPVFQGIPVPLLWAFNDTSGNPVKGLRLCKVVNADGTCGTAGVVAPWVNLSLTAVSTSTPCKQIATASSPSLPSVLNSGLVNLGKGQYGFAWNTLTNIKSLKGCQVRVVLQFNNGVLIVSAPALFQYQL